MMIIPNGLTRHLLAFLAQHRVSLTHRETSTGLDSLLKRASIIGLVYYWGVYLEDMSEFTDRVERKLVPVLMEIFPGQQRLRRTITLKSGEGLVQVLINLALRDLP